LLVLARDLTVSVDLTMQ